MLRGRDARFSHRAAGWYLFGAIFGPASVRRLVVGYGRSVLLTPQLNEWLADAYQRRPVIITLIGQFIPTVRIYQALPAGVFQLPPVPFLSRQPLEAFAGSAFLPLPGLVGGGIRTGAA